MTDPNQSIGYRFQVACREGDLDQVNQICQMYPDQVRDEWSARHATMRSQIAVLDMLMEQYPDLIARIYSLQKRACIIRSSLCGGSSGRGLAMRKELILSQRDTTPLESALLGISSYSGC